MNHIILQILKNSQEHMENMQEQLEQMDQLISYLAAYFVKMKSISKLRNASKYCLHLFVDFEMR